MQLKQLTAFEAIEFVTDLNCYFPRIGAFTIPHLAPPLPTLEYVLALPRKPLSGTTIVSVDPTSFEPDSIAMLEEGETWSVVEWNGFGDLSNDSFAIVRIEKQGAITGYLIIKDEPAAIDGFDEIGGEEDFDEEQINNIKRLLHDYSHVVMHM